MKLAQILASIAAATIKIVVLFAAAWRATRIEKRSGSPPWYLGAGIVAYGLTAAGFGYTYRNQPITTALEVFGAGAVAEVLGAAVIFGIFHAVFRKDVQPTGQRIFEIGASVFLLVGISLSDPTASRSRPSV